MEGKEPVEHKEETLAKARNRLLTSVFAPYGGVQVARFLEGDVVSSHEWKDKSDKSKILNLYEKAMKEDDVDRRRSIVEKADNMALDKNLVIKDLRKQAATNLKREETGFASKIEERLQHKGEDAFVAELQKMIDSGSLTKEGAAKVVELRINRFKKADKYSADMAEQNAEYAGRGRNRVKSEFFTAVDDIIRAK
jgi:hypothetical protein